MLKMNARFVKFLLPLAQAEITLATKRAGFVGALYSLANEASVMMPSVYARGLCLYPRKRLLIEDQEVRTHHGPLPRSPTLSRNASLSFSMRSVQAVVTRPSFPY